jgi:anti-sigma B factor antagonist
MDITIAERPAGAVTVLDLAGRLTIDGGAQRLKDTINALVARGRTRILVNLHDVPYIDSGGLGQLVASYGSVVKSGGALKLLHTSARNHHLLVITHLVTVFDSFDSESDALRSFAPGEAPQADAAVPVHSAMGTNPA